MGVEGNTPNLHHLHPLFFSYPLLSFLSFLLLYLFILYSQGVRKVDAFEELVSYVKEMFASKDYGNRIMVEEVLLLPSAPPLPFHTSLLFLVSLLPSLPPLSLPSTICSYLLISFSLEMNSRLLCFLLALTRSMEVSFPLPSSSFLFLPLPFSSFLFLLFI